MAQTQTGSEILNKYKSYLMANESTCGLVNKFIAEAQSCRYDNGVNEALEKIVGDLPEEQFAKKDNVYSVSLKGKDLQKITNEVFTVVMDATPSLTKEDKDLFNEELKNVDFNVRLNQRSTGRI